MDSHPVPQNVTSFQFKLVGDMTLKQFLYLVAGVGVAYLCFVFLAHSAPLLAWPIIIISSFLGVAFAFFPISDRPLDHWMGAFLKAIYSPTQRRWQKGNQTYTNNPLFQSRLNTYFSSLISPPPLPAPPPPPPIVQTMPQPIPIIHDLPTNTELSKTVDLAQKAQSLQVQIIETERELAQVKNTQQAQQFNATFEKLQNLNQEASSIKQQLTSLSGETSKPILPAITIVKPPPARTTQLVLTSLPNVINGIINDQTGNYLDEVVVVIFDKDGLPVRALKTNKLGQFTGATPLPSGTYTIELEKEGFIFDLLQIELKGETLSPIQIIAKKAVIT